MLPNGNLDFDSGIAEQTIEVLPNGNKTYVLKMNIAWRAVSLLHLRHPLRQPRGQLLALVDQIEPAPVGQIGRVSRRRSVAGTSSAPG